MNLTPDNKAFIDSLSYQGLLRRWRVAPIGDPWVWVVKFEKIEGDEG